MMVLGADAHKRSPSIAAVAAATGELRGDKTVAVGEKGFTRCSIGRVASKGSGSRRLRTVGTCRDR